MVSDESWPNCEVVWLSTVCYFHNSGFVADSSVCRYVQNKSSKGSKGKYRRNSIHEMKVKNLKMCVKSSKGHMGVKDYEKHSKVWRYKILEKIHTCKDMCLSDLKFNIKE